jgi:hypothetical protein
VVTTVAYPAHRGPLTTETPHWGASA